MRTNILKISIAAIMTFSFVIQGCGSKLPDIENHILDNDYREDAKVFRTLYSSEVLELNYMKTISAIDTVISANVIDALVDFDCNGNIIPGLAKSWESNKDSTKWTFYLRDGITWVNYKGEYYADVTADDFVAAAEYVNNASNSSDSQYMYSTGSVVEGAQEYYEYTKYLLSPESYEEAPPQVKPSDIGVKAVNDKTVVFTIKRPCPFFPSVLTYPSYFPICRKYLAEVGSMFARNHKNILYNGAYILSYFQPLEKQILVKNPSYWDADNVHIDRVENYYDTEAAVIAPEQYMDGIIDKAAIPSDKLEEYLKDPKMKEEIHRSRPDLSFSYFYAFNFMPNIDPSFEPDNWKKAVVNENFRKAVMSCVDKVKIASIYEPYSPESLVNYTLTPVGAIGYEGKDYTEYADLLKCAKKYGYDSGAALRYKATAKRELEKENVTFPIKMLMPYNPLIEGWKDETLMVAKAIEDILGEDFIDVIIEVGGDSGYLTNVRRSGKYAFMRCRWGADYDDPYAWTEPFMDGSRYMFWNMSKDEGIRTIYNEWHKKIDAASEITTDINDRMKTFAEAEKLLIENTIIVPLCIMNTEGYIMSKINELEGEYASYGIVTQRFKYCKLYEKSMNMKEFEKKYAKWLGLGTE